MPDSHTDANPYTNAYGHTNANTYHGYSDTYADDCDTDSYSYNGDTNAYAYSYTNADSHTDTKEDCWYVCAGNRMAYSTI